MVAQPPHPPPAPNRPPDETQSRSPHPQGLKGCPDPPSALLSLLCDLRWARQPLCASGSSSVNALVGGSKEGERSRELRSGDQSPRLGSRACALLPARGRDEVTTAAGGSGSDVRRTSSRPTSWNPQTEVVRDVGSAHSRERVSQATGPKLEGGCPPPLTVPGRPRSARPRSCPGHHRTWSSAGSASPPPPSLAGAPHRQTASPAEGGRL